ncbi:uncharacterized protein LOC123013240 [Tribolium madens]|uniref:uncharacterized protein LOC123013240 n=1 Tax=Tribolium madens TaxID=41895 RepID=UPI001CF735A6|nr:uncharacterized protein LOC123013240 [Tribolium madens]
MSISFKMQKLITEVQKQPCLWNVHLPSYSDKPLKVKAWKIICRAIYPRTVENTADEKSKIAFIQKKWKSVRDYYTKQRKEFQSELVAGSKRKKYVYFDMLRFLEAKFDEENTLIGSWKEDSSDLNLTEDTSEGDKNPAIKQEELDLNEETTIKSDDVDLTPDLIHTEGSPLQHSRQDIDEDEMFLLSLLPSMRKLSPLQKMDFKLEVMNSLKKIQFSNASSRQHL